MKRFETNYDQSKLYKPSKDWRQSVSLSKLTGSARFREVSEGVVKKRSSRNRFRTFNVVEETSTQERLLFCPIIQVLSACPLNGYFSVAKLSSRINSLTLAEDSGVIFERS